MTAFTDLSQAAADAMTELVQSHTETADDDGGARVAE